MALKNNVSVFAYGQKIDFLDAYIKVDSVHGNKETMSVSIVFLDQKDGVKCYENTYSFQHSLENKNVIEQAYLYLKTLPEFENAEDC